MNKTITAFILLLALCGVVVSQPAQNEDTQEEESHRPYTQEEFPGWLRQLRRAEIVFFGSFPITMVFTTLSYEGFRLVRSVVEQNAVAGTMATEFGSFSEDEKIGLLLSGAILAVAVSVVDFILERAESKLGE